MCLCMRGQWQYGVFFSCWCMAQGGRCSVLCHCLSGDSYIILAGQRHGYVFRVGTRRESDMPKKCTCNGVCFCTAYYSCVCNPNATYKWCGGLQAIWSIRNLFRVHAEERERERRKETVNYGYCFFVIFGSLWFRSDQPALRKVKRVMLTYYVGHLLSQFYNRTIEISGSGRGVSAFKTFQSELFRTNDLQTVGELVWYWYRVWFCYVVFFCVQLRD